MAPRYHFSVLALLLLSAATRVSSQYIGKRIGKLSELQHDVRGEVYAVDSRTIHVKGFSYDGNAPDAFFYGGFSGLPSDEGFIIPDENGSTKPLGRYRNKDVTLTLPEGITLKDVKWISVWCRAFAIDFGHLIVPSGLQYPRPQKINALSTLDHGVSSDRLVVVDAQTFLIPNFSYDGAAPGGYQSSRSRSSAGRYQNRNGRTFSGRDSEEERDFRRYRPSSSGNGRFRSSSESVFGSQSFSRSPFGGGARSNTKFNVFDRQNERFRNDRGHDNKRNNDRSSKTGQTSPQDLAYRHFHG